MKTQISGFFLFFQISPFDLGAPMENLFEMMCISDNQRIVEWGYLVYRMLIRENAQIGDHPIGFVW